MINIYLRKISKALGKLKAQSLKAFYKEVSAKTNKNIQRLFNNIDIMIQEKFDF